MNPETSISTITNQLVNGLDQNIANCPISIENEMHGPADMNELERRVGEVVEQCKKNDVVSNKEILRLSQSKILPGRSLNIEREDATSFAGVFVPRPSLEKRTRLRAEEKLRDGGR